MIYHMLYKENGNWHEDRTNCASLHGHGADLVMVGGKYNGERFIIECKGKSYSKSHNSINREGWLNALGQIVTRMNTERIIQKGSTKGSVNKSYKYGSGLCEISARIALKKYPKK